MVFFLSPLEVITDSLPEMVIGEPGVETVTSKSMKFCYDGPLGQWDGLDDGVDIFLKEIQAAFERCKGVPTDITQSVEHLNPDFATAEHLQVGSEIDLDGRFKNNVVSKVRSVLMTLTNPKFADGREPTDLPALPRSFKFGSSKVFAAALRPIGSELDKVFKIPGDGPDQQVRLICELKSCSTVNIAEMIKRGTESCEKDSFRNLIGMSTFWVNPLLANNCDQVKWLEICSSGVSSMRLYPHTKRRYSSRLIELILILVIGACTTRGE